LLLSVDHAGLTEIDRPIAETDHVLKNTNQTTPRINTARPRLIAKSARIDGPGSAWRASVADSTICSFCLVAEFLIIMAPSFRLLLDADEIPCGTVWKATRDLDRCSGYSLPHRVEQRRRSFAANQQRRFLRTQLWSMPQTYFDSATLSRLKIL
jgi:hypothetical protein